MTIQDAMLVIAIVTMVIASVVAGVYAMERRVKDPTIALAIMGARRSAPLRVQLKMLVFILVTLALAAIVWRGVG